MKRITSVGFCILFFLPIVNAQSSIPFKESKYYELKLDYDFKNKSGAPTSEVYTSRPVSKNTTVLPFLEVIIDLLEVQGEEYRVKVINNFNETITNQKIDLSKPIKIRMGFTEDMKDRTEAHQYIILFQNKSREVLRKIELEVMEDGTFLVNKEVHGKL